MVKKYNVYEGGDIEYEIHVENVPIGTEYSLIASQSGTWLPAIKGTRIMTLVETGNDIKLDNSYDDLSYSQSVELELLLAFSRSQHPVPGSYNIVDQ